MTTIQRVSRSLQRIALVLSAGAFASPIAADEPPSPGKASKPEDSQPRSEPAPGTGDLDAPARGVRLHSGSRLEGKILKRTQKDVFLDVGFTVLRIPVEEVAQVLKAEGAEAGEPAKGTSVSSSTGAAGAPAVREGVFFSADLAPGSIEEKAREVSEAVLHILCLGKSGSGFIVNDKEGYVVTNYHVIEKERDIAVVIYMRGDLGLTKVKKDKVRIIALSPFFDLALLKIEDLEGVRLRKAFLGDYDRVNVGDPVFAIGNPLGLERTVSEGIVSSRNRALSGVLLIQTTAPINPGNSGGPLFNNRGEVIGVTSSGFLGAEGLNFAIPVHYLKDFLRNLDAFAFDKDNPNTGIRYLPPPPKVRAPGADRSAGSGTAPDGNAQR
jgi:serine protease Do